jgi:hypothetical protein
MSIGKLQKMTLTPYPDITFGAPIPGIDPYTVLINPETYSLTYSQAINVEAPQGKSLPVISYNRGNTQTMNFKFLFDGTGVIKTGDGGLLSGLASGIAIPGKNATISDVATQLAKFKKVVYDFYGDKHQPPYVQIKWGVLLYNCLLTQMNITFKLFKPDGTPLRAEADCTFTSAIELKKLIALMDKKSPDLTHVRTVKEGDTLSLMCYREYGDSEYYYQIAQFNNLIDFKNLIPGTNLLFPPVIIN